MIPNQWYVVLEASEVRRDRPLAVTRLGESLAFWRTSTGEIACVRARCPHRGASLARGAVRDGDLVCPFHGFRFDASGHCTAVPCNGRAQPPSRAIRASALRAAEANGFVYVWSGDADPGDERPRFFDDIEPDMPFASGHETWQTHYARVVENQLDVAHLPFVHRNTIGRGGRTLVDGPLVEWLGEDRFRVYVQNRVDDGSMPLRPEEMRRPNVPFHLEFVFPNLWQNHISDSTRIVAAFVPIDDETSALYLRYYMRLPLPPALARLLCRLAMPANTYVARQDKRVVQSQVPLRPALRGGEKLVQADRPIVAYRQRREELRQAATETR
jgi:phenylpropionate dioxygenase-like ring-hydroxylating dioxygenase large terminal subunit